MNRLFALLAVLSLGAVIGCTQPKTPTSTKSPSTAPVDLTSKSTQPAATLTRPAETRPTPDKLPEKAPDKPVEKTPEKAPDKPAENKTPPSPPK